MKSRTYRTCETILKKLIEKYNPLAKIGMPLIDLVIKEYAGGDERTLKRYREDLVSLEFVKANRDGTYSLNWKKVVNANQQMFQECLVISEDEPP